MFICMKPSLSRSSMKLTIRCSCLSISSSYLFLNILFLLAVIVAGVDLRMLLELLLLLLRMFVAAAAVLVDVELLAMGVNLSSAAHLLSTLRWDDSLPFELHIAENVRINARMIRISKSMYICNYIIYYNHAFVFIYKILY